MTNVVYFPAFTEPDSLQAQAARAIWYLSPLQPTTVRMQTHLALAPSAVDEYTPEVGAHLDPPPEWLLLSPEPINLKTLERADIVLLWQGAEVLNTLGKDIAARLKKLGVAVYDVAFDNHLEGSRYIEVSREHLNNDEQVSKRSSAMFATLSEAHQNKDTANLFCSGPCVSGYTNYAFDGGLNIVCNSVINDDDLLGAAPPHIQIFGDPIFHFGCSRYAHAFRSKLAQTHERYGFSSIIPIKYYNLFSHWYPKLAESTIAIPFERDIQINLDLGHQFKLRTTDNILTFVMLPVACSLAKQINMLGCDGRPLNDNQYFWEHNPNAQFVGEMANIQHVHPSFFTVDYDEYYLRHCSNVESYLEAGEAQGRNFRVLTPSHIPALRQRQISNIQTASKPIQMTQPSTPIDNPSGDAFALADMAWELAKQRMESQKEQTAADLRIQSADQVIATQKALIAKLEADLTATRADQEQFAAQLTALESSLTDLRGQTAQITGINERLEQLSESTQRLGTGLSQQGESTEQLSQLASASQSELAELESQWQHQARHRSNEPDFQSFPRFLDLEELKAMTRLAQSAFGLDLNHRSVAYLAHHIRQVESACVGRLATSIHAALIRALAALSLKDEQLNYIEIGVLFGVNTAIVWDLLRHKFKSTRITCIDPLAGYYDPDAPDTITSFPISSAVLKHNLNKVHADNRRITILEGYSEDPEILEKASKRKYNYLLIDGDHSYDGVRRDFENYAPLVTSGGIIVIDDYGVKEWQEVTDYADQVVMKLPGYEVLNTTHRTLILRKH